MIARTYGHMDIGWVRKIQERMSGTKPGSDEVREGSPVRYAENLPKAASN